MPYKVIGKNLWHRKGGYWSIKQRCRSHDNALKAKRLLESLEKGGK